MRFWWVNHKQTYKQEVGDGYLWSPKTKKCPAHEGLVIIRPATWWSRIPILAACVAAILLCAFSGAAAVGVRQIAGIASVIDGDTIEIHGTRIRLFGIDAPESRQSCSKADMLWRCGQRAALALSDFVGRTPLVCDAFGHDRYRRVIARCFRNGLDINRWMVANGWAVAYRRYSRDYVADEDGARADRLGIWSGTFMMPWDWRATKGR